MPEHETSSARATRRIAADPTSTALLLAGPLALELWPRVRSAAERLPSAAGRALPPLRTPTTFVTRFEGVGPRLSATSAVLTLNYDGGTAGPAPTTSATLTVDSTGAPGSRLDGAALQTLADGFLDNLATVAEARSSAA